MPEGEEMQAFLRAVDDLGKALEETIEKIGHMQERVALIRTAHEEGTLLREIVPADQTPVLVQLLTETTNLLHAYGNRVRTTEARALHSEGMTMDEIARVFGVTRQRVSALLRSTRESA